MIKLIQSFTNCSLIDRMQKYVKKSKDNGKQSKCKEKKLSMNVKGRKNLSHNDIFSFSV